MSRSKALIIAALALGVTSGVDAQQQPAPPQLPQAPNMTFFVTGAGPGKGADLGGIEGAGWRLVYSNTVPDMLKSAESALKYTDLRFSLGLTIMEGGAVGDVIPGSPADKAGVGAAMKLVAVNGRRWTPDLLRTAVKAAMTNTAPIELLVENEDYFKSCKLDYHEGEKYPWLERNSTKPDLLKEILKPLTPAP